MALPQQWSLRDIQQEPTPTGQKITVYTDVPCHLWMRWSLKENLVHTVPALRRGIQVHCEPYFCFTAYHDNEQEEAGDTIIHTFIKEPWPDCETRWFYFWGTIGGEISPSTSAIFRKHPAEELLPGDIDIFADGESGWLWGKHANWFTCRNLAEGLPYEHVTSLHLVSRLTPGGEYWIRRGVLRFDTSPVPAKCKITELTLYLYVWAKSQCGSHNIWLVTGFGMDENMRVTDYRQIFENTRAVSTPKPIADIQLNAYNPFPFYFDQYQTLNPSGFSIFSLRTSLDRLDITPVICTHAARIEAASSEHATFPPYLHVAWIP